MFLDKAKDSAFWQSVREKDSYREFRENLLTLWEKYGELSIPALKFSDFQLFFTTGDRAIYESAYFLRRQTLNCSALLTLIYPDEEKYLHRLEDIIFIICDEYTWCLPAHQPGITRNITNHLDLFATETGFALSEIYTLLGNRLTPLIRERIKYAVDTRIITSYTDGRHYWWEKTTNNWAAVCMSGVAACIMYMRPELFDSCKPRFDETMRGFLSGFGDDGFCLEGIGYWNYGFGFYTVYADLIRDFTGGREDPFRNPKVASIATFLQKVFLSGNASVSFSDGSRKCSADVGLIHFLRHEYGDRIEPLDCVKGGFARGCARWCLDIRKLVWFNENEHPAPLAEKVSYYAADAEWFIHKTPFFGFAAKGGTNGESHNHNDIGTFIIAADGRQIFGDFGCGRYTRQYFLDETRYTILHCSSLGHSVPYFGDGVQMHGKEFHADSVKAEDGAFSLDLAPAYSIPELTHFYRSFSLTDRSMTLTDTIETKGTLPVTERFVLLEEPVLKDGGFTAASLTVTYGDSVSGVTVMPTPFDEHNAASAPSMSYLVDLTLKPGAAGFTMTVSV